MYRLIGGSDFKLIYRHYATLYFVFCVDSSESELGILDLIQVTFCLSSLCILYCILGLAFSACEVLPSNAVGGTIQILAVVVIVIEFMSIILVSLTQPGKFVFVRVITWHADYGGHG